jgi:hypothetical protein
METLLIKVKNKTETEFLVNLVKRLGIKARPLKKRIEG